MNVFFDNTSNGELFVKCSIVTFRNFDMMLRFYWPSCNYVIFRIGVDSSIKNKEGKRAEEILQHVKPEGWENTHKTFCKFYPGIYVMCKFV